MESVLVMAVYLSGIGELSAKRQFEQEHDLLQIYLPTLQSSLWKTRHDINTGVFQFNTFIVKSQSI